MMFAVLARKGRSWEVEPSPRTNSGIYIFVICMSVLMYINSVLLPDSLQEWLRELSGPPGPRFRHAFFFLAPLVAAYFPAYFYFFLSKGGQIAQRRFDARVAPLLDASLLRWRLTILGIFIVGIIPAGFASYFPLTAALCSLALIIISSWALRAHLRRLGV